MKRSTIVALFFYVFLTFFHSRYCDVDASQSFVTGNAIILSSMPRRNRTTMRPLAHAKAEATTPLFADNFAGDTIGQPASGWSNASGSWSVCAPLEGARAYCQNSKGSSMSMQQRQWVNYQVDTVAYTNQLSIGGVALLGRMQSASQYYQIELKRNPASGIISWYVAKTNGYTWTILLSGPVQISPTAYYHLRLGFFGDQVSAWIASDSGTDYAFLGAVADSQYSSGGFGLRTFGTSAARFTSVGAVSETSLVPSTSGEMETPLRADALVDSIGVNVALNTIAASSVAGVSALARSLGVRHVRIAILKKDTAYVNIVNQFLNITGAHALGITDCTPPLGYYPTAGLSLSDVQTFQAAIGGRLEAYESFNEPDARSSVDHNWVADTLSCMSALTQALPGTPFLAPAIANQEADAAKLGNVSAIVNAGNIHRYFAGNNPGTLGWGGYVACGAYGALSWAQCEAGINSGTEPQMITETGYSSTTEVDEATQAKYLSRAFFVNSQANIVRTYVYSLLSYTGSDGFGGDGLLELNLTPKPAYSAIQSLIGLFSDAGTDTRVRAAVTYDVAAMPSTMRHELFQRRDGSFIMAVWNEAKSWQPNGGGEIPVLASPVTIWLPFVPVSIAVETLNDYGAMQLGSVNVAGNAITFSVDDHMSFLIFRHS